MSHQFSSSFSQTILLVGPDPSRGTLGGVVKHMEVLRKLSVLNKVPIFDPGSTQGQLTVSDLPVAVKCLKLTRVLSKGDFHQVWIQVSIHTTGILKLFLILLALHSHSEITIRIFFHGGRFEEISYLRKSIIRHLAKRLLQKVDSLHFLSAEQGNGFSSIFPGISWERFANFLPVNSTLARKRSDRTILLFVGRLVREKGIYEILNAFEQLRRLNIGNDLVLWFAGDGPEMKNLLRMTRVYEPGLIRLWGRLDSEALEDVYSQAFALLLPSYHREGFPYVVVEAMRAGLPIIASPTGVLPDLIREGENGFLVPPRSADALADIIKLLLENRQLCETIGENNVRYFKNHLSKKVGEEYYKGLLILQ